MLLTNATGFGHAGASLHSADLSLLDWVSAVAGENGQLPAAHHRLLLWELEAISRGSNDRLMVLMPPGSAKSTYASVLFPAWWFLQHPATSVIATSHTASLASYFARQVRQLIARWEPQLGYKLESSARATTEWRISTGGEYFCSGIRGPIMGRRADLAIIDDPVKSQAEADSLRTRERLWNWYRQDLITRLKPHARIILIMTRWHEDDLAGRLLARGTDEWRCLRLPALASPGDPLGRSSETPLWPEWEDERSLLRKKLELGERAWSAMFQQSPCNPTGALFKIGKIGISEILPDPGARAVRAWDLAATDEHEGRNPDWTVGLKLIRDEAGRFIIGDIARIQGSPNQVEQLLLQTARLDGPSVVIGLPEDPGQAGKSQAGYLKRMLAGYTVTSSKETGSKQTRAAAVASQVEAGNISIVRAAWNYSFLDELKEFPFGSKDDQVDALSRAFHMLVQAHTLTRQTNIPYLER